MFKKKCHSLDHLPFPRRYRHVRQSDHLHYYPNYHFHIPPHQQKHLQQAAKNVRRSTSQSNARDAGQFAAAAPLAGLNVHHSSSSNSANWRLNSSTPAVQRPPSIAEPCLKHHDSDLSLHSSLSNHSNLSSISVNSSNFCTSSQANTTSGIPSSSYSSSAPGAPHLYQPPALPHHLHPAAGQHPQSALIHSHALYYPGRLDKYRQALNRSNCTNHPSQINTSQCSGDYVIDSSMQPTPPPLPRYSSYTSISSQPFRSNLTTPIAGSLHLTASQISLEFNTWYSQLQIHQEEQQKAARRSVREWVRCQPLSILQLDSADREVLKIAGKCFFVDFIRPVRSSELVMIILIGSWSFDSTDSSDLSIFAQKFLASS